MKTPIFKLEKNKRYYLHTKLRKEGFRYDALGRTIYTSGENKLSDTVLKLRDKYGYSVQCEIPN